MFFDTSVFVTDCIFFLRFISSFWIIWLETNRAGLHEWVLRKNVCIFFLKSKNCAKSYSRNCSNYSKCLDPVTLFVAPNAHSCYSFILIKSIGCYEKDVHLFFWNHRRSLFFGTIHYWNVLQNCLIWCNLRRSLNNFQSVSFLRNIIQPLEIPRWASLWNFRISIEPEIYLTC